MTLAVFRTHSMGCSPFLIVLSCTLVSPSFLTAISYYPEPSSHLSSEFPNSFPNYADFKFHSLYFSSQQFFSPSLSPRRQVCIFSYCLDFPYPRPTGISDTIHTKLQITFFSFIFSPMFHSVTSTRIFGLLLSNLMG